MARKMPTYESVYKEYDKGLTFNAQISLNDTVRDNENFFIGKQWEGVASNGLSTPVFNFLKRVTLFQVANITTDNIKMNASPLSATGISSEMSEAAEIVNKEFEALMEHNNVCGLLREFARNAAVDGDGCLYTYWDADVETGQQTNGAIVTEVIENNRVFFGNANDRRVQKQPYIIISSREMIDDVRERAGVSEDDTTITPDNDERDIDSVKATDDKVTVLLRMWRNKETKTIWAYESTRTATVRKAWDTGLKRYPIVWLCWDYIQDSYHGQSLITGLIPNQVFVNKIWAMTMLSLMSSAYPKTVYDKTRVSAWDNRVGAAIGINGGDVNQVAKIIEPAQISPQISQFIQLAVEQTQTFLGASSVALGDSRPDNTSAIIALQRAASVPSEITKQNLYQCLEDLGRIYIDFMAQYYGVRAVQRPANKVLGEEVMQFAAGATAAQVQPDTPMPVYFDFSILKDNPMSLKLDIGASAYWSEIASVQTLDNLLMQGQIDIVDYLERIPDGYVSKRQELIDAIKARRQTALPPSMDAQQANGAGEASGQVIAPTASLPIPETAGNSALQRAVVKESV